mgnify:CR=1 FL=1
MAYSLSCFTISKFEPQGCDEGTWEATFLWWPATKATWPFWPLAGRLGEVAGHVPYAWYFTAVWLFPPENISIRGIFCGGKPWSFLHTLYFHTTSPFDPYNELQALVLGVRKNHLQACMQKSSSISLISLRTSKSNTTISSTPSTSTLPSSIPEVWRCSPRPKEPQTHAKRQPKSSLQG